MIRKVVIVVLTLAAVIVICLGVDSYVVSTHLRERPIRNRNFWVTDVLEGSCVYTTSWSGWFRFGIIDGHPVPEDNEGWSWLRGFVKSPFPGKAGHLGTTVYVPGVFAACDYKLGMFAKKIRVRAVAVTHWIVVAALLSYPTLVFFRGPLKRWRRPRKGLCSECGYNLIGNISGVCPECGTPL